MKHRAVSDAMSKQVYRARPTMPLCEVVQVLAEHHLTALPVVDSDEQLIGVVAEADVLSAVHGRSPRTVWSRNGRRRQCARPRTIASDVMTTRPVTISPTDTPDAAARQMIKHRVRSLPVVNQRGRLVGMVSRSDLLARLMRSDEAIAAEVSDDVLTRELWVDPTSVSVQVQDGIVTLRGTVERHSISEAAERLVRGLDGVFGVVNELACPREDANTP